MGKGKEKCGRDGSYYNEEEVRLVIWKKCIEDITRWLEDMYFMFEWQEQLGTLRKTRRQRQRERHQTKGSMSRTIAVHVRYKSLYISLPSSAKQHREMTKFCVAWRT